jgi:hypothetical protein
MYEAILRIFRSVANIVTGQDSVARNFVGGIDGQLLGEIRGHSFRSEPESTSYELLIEEP